MRRNSYVISSAIRVYASQEQSTLEAWKAREQAFIQIGRPIDTPSFITRLRVSVPTHDSRSSTAVSGTPTAATQQQHPMNDADFLGGYMDVTSLNRDTWGDITSGNSFNNNNKKSLSRSSQRLWLRK
jgi:hypothetical protein